MAAVALGLLALVVGGLKIPALTHGVVLSVLPAPAARTSIAIALWSGVAAVTCGIALLATAQDRPPGDHRPWAERLFRA
jgi:ABC-type Fe3+ transport system permease subunit